jgi:hypothetical protein
MDRRNFSKSDATPVVSDRTTVAELKHSPIAVNALRALNIPARQIKSNTPPCERTFDKIHSRDGD